MVLLERPLAQVLRSPSTANSISALAALPAVPQAQRCNDLFDRDKQQYPNKGCDVGCERDVLEVFPSCPSVLDF